MTHMKQNWRLPKQQRVADEEKSLIKATSHFTFTRNTAAFFFKFQLKLHLLQIGTFLFQNKTGAYFAALCWFLFAFPNFLERWLVFLGGGEGKAGDWCRNPDMMKIVEFCPSQTKHSSWTPKRKHSTCGLQSETDRTGTKSWQSFRI